MALIYADDFQQLKYADKIVNFGMHGNSQADANAVNNGVEALGFERPISITLRQASAGVNQYYVQTPVGYWDDSRFNCLCVYARPPTTFVNDGVISTPGVNGLKRLIKQKGDTVFVSLRWAFPVGFQFTSAIAGVPFIKCGYGIGISLSTVGTLALNGVDTGYEVLFETEVPLIMEIVAGPEYVELWIGADMVVRQTRQSIPVDFFTLGFEPVTALPNSIFIQYEAVIKLYSLIIADSSGTRFNSRIGRKIVRSYEANAVTTDATLETTAGTAVATLRRPVQDLVLDTGAPVYGNLYSSKPYVKTTLTGTKPPEFVPRGMCVHIQAKRRSPVNDNMTVFPFLSIGGVDYVDTVGQQLRARWTGKCTPIEIPDNAIFSSFSFGYTHDYLDIEKIYVDDRTKVEVYGPQLVAYEPPLLVFQSRKPTLFYTELQTASFVGYSYEYTLSKLNINNLTYMQEQ